MNAVTATACIKVCIRTPTPTPFQPSETPAHSLSAIPVQRHARCPLSSIPPAHSRPSSALLSLASTPSAPSHGTPRKQDKPTLLCSTTAQILRKSFQLSSQGWSQFQSSCTSISVAWAAYLQARLPRDRIGVHLPIRCDSRPRSLGVRSYAYLLRSERYPTILAAIHLGPNVPRHGR